MTGPTECLAWPTWSFVVWVFFCLFLNGISYSQLNIERFHITSEDFLLFYKGGHLLILALPFPRQYRAGVGADLPPRR